MKTTLNEILEHDPCGQESEGRTGFSKLLKCLDKTKADDEPLEFETILKSNGIKDAVWCLRVLDYNGRRLFQADVAESVLHIFGQKYPDDDRPRKAIEAARNPELTTGELSDAANAAYAAYAAAHAAAYAAAHAANEAANGAAYAAAHAALAALAPHAAPQRKDKWNEIETLFTQHFCTHTEPRKANA